MIWSEYDVSTLKRLWVKGYSASQCAQQIGGFTRNAIIGKVHRLGLAGRYIKKKPRDKKPVKRLSRPQYPMKVIRVNPKRDRDKKSDIIEIPRHGECRGDIGGEGMDLKLCRKEINRDEIYCEQHRKRYYPNEQATITEKSNRSRHRSW